SSVTLSSLLPLPNMPKGKKANGKKVALAPAVVKKQEAKKMVNPLFEKRSKNFDIGQDIQPKGTSPLSHGLWSQPAFIKSHLYQLHMVQDHFYKGNEHM
uniref:Uncharacterized protein n=1 Tax=Rhinolophus ferrumequinum TaxID=59479 RepID=A0A671EIM1_RHIFE